MKPCILISLTAQHFYALYPQVRFLERSIIIIAAFWWGSPVRIHLKQLCINLFGFYNLWLLHSQEQTVHINPLNADMHIFK